MQVVDHQSKAWVLFTHEDRYLFDVNCSFGAFGYSVLIELNGREVARMQAEGRDYLHHLADEIQCSAPAAQGSHSRYAARDLTRSLGAATTEAFLNWRSAKDADAG